MGEDPNHKVDGSLVTADTTVPTVSSVVFVGSPWAADEETYAAGDWVGVHQTLSESVLVTGVPRIELAICGTAR